MSRSVPEWFGKSPDSMPPASVKRRILDRQDNRCAITGLEFTPQDPPEFDHIVAIWLKGKNCESNLQAIRASVHKRKTKTEATVRAKVNRIRSKHYSLSQSKNPLPGGKKSKWKKKLTGEVVLR